MLIRAEQMSVFELTAEEKFARRLAAHLLENYGQAIVRLPDSESALAELPEEILHSLIKNSIERARRYELTFESSISAFTAIRFEVSPNFDNHRLSQVMLNDEHIEPDARLDELLEVLTEKNWETIRGEYDVNAWQTEPAAATESENPAEAKELGEAENIEFADTVINVENTEKSKKSDVSPVPDFDLTMINADTETPKTAAEVKRFDLDATMMNFENPGKSNKSGDDEDFDFLDTIVNIDVTKE